MGMFSSVAPGGAAPGDEVASIDIPVPQPISTSKFGVSVAVDDEGSLYYTNWLSPFLHEIDASGGLIGSKPLVDQDGQSITLGEISWDPGRQLLWAGTDTGSPELYLLDPETGVATYQFDMIDEGNGDLVDGLAYDGSDDTIWHSPDGGNRIYHYDVSGNTLPAIDPKRANGISAFVSGILVATDGRLLVNDGPDIIVVSQTTGDYLDSFPRLPLGVEGLACDPFNFTVPVLWSRGDRDNIVAMELEPDLCAWGGLDECCLINTAEVSWKTLTENGAPGVRAFPFEPQVRAFELFDGDLHLGGSFEHAGTRGGWANGVARLEAEVDRVGWGAVGDGFDFSLGTSGGVYDLEVFEGELYAAGEFSTSDGVTVNNVARWNGACWQPLPGAGEVGTNGPVFALQALGGLLYVGGSFTQAGGEATNSLARWDGSEWFPLDWGSQGDAVQDMTVWGSTLAIGGISSGASVRVWDGVQWLALPSEFGFFDPIFALGSFAAGGQGFAELFAGGFFGVRRYVPGSGWQTPGNPPGGIEVHALEVWNRCPVPVLVAAGATGASGWAGLWDGSLWADLPESSSLTGASWNVVEAVHESPYFAHDGVFVGGSFGQVDTPPKPAGAIALWGCPFVPFATDTIDWVPLRDPDSFPCLSHSTGGGTDPLGLTPLASTGTIHRFGGFNGATRLDETWRLDPDGWTQLATVGSPSPRSGHAMTTDRGRSVLVVFGGDEGTAVNGDTWEFDGASWTLRATNGPSPRAFAGFAFDEVRGVSVLYGGEDASGKCDDTWEWDGTGWTQRQVGSPPGARTHHAMSFDVAAGRIVLFGGKTPAGRSAETWGWDGAGWTMLAEAGPSARAGHALTYDRYNDVLVLFGGEDDGGLSDELWEYVNGNWLFRQTVVSPGARKGHGLAFDEAEVQLILTGGFTGAIVGDTWTMDRFDVSTAVAPAQVASDGRSVSAFPNPFSGQTTLRFALRQAGSVSVRVYDLQGRLVRTLVDGQRGAGPHEIVWRGRNEAGQRASAGVYFWIVRAEGVEQRGKLVRLE